MPEKENEVLVRLVIQGPPRTKKNSMRIIQIAGKPRLIPSTHYEQFSKDCLWQIPSSARLGIDTPVNVKCLYYMPTRRRVDMVNLLEATCDILVDAGVIADDNSNIVAGHDGSRVLYDKLNPRTELEISRLVSLENKSRK